MSNNIDFTTGSLSTMSSEDCNRIHLISKIGISSYRISGYCREDMNTNDIILYHEKEYRIVSVQKRDSRGVFVNPANRINSFFEADCDLITGN